MSGRHAAPDDGADGGAAGGGIGGGTGGGANGAAGGGTAPAGRPTLRIIRGNPTPEEVAAVAVVLTALSGGGEPEQPAHPGGWSDPAFRLRRPIQAGPGAWRMSSWL